MRTLAKRLQWGFGALVVVPVAAIAVGIAILPFAILAWGVGMLLGTDLTTLIPVIAIPEHIAKGLIAIFVGSLILWFVITMALGAIE